MQKQPFSVYFDLIYNVLAENKKSADANHVLIKLEGICDNFKKLGHRDYFKIHMPARVEAHMVGSELRCRGEFSVRRRNV